MDSGITDKLDEQQLLLQLRNDDHAAFTQIYQYYCRRLLAMAYNYCREKSLAEEIVQEVFVGLWERRHDVQIRSLDAYLATAIKFSIFRTVHRQLRRDELVKRRLPAQEAGFDHEQIYARFLQEYIDGVVEQLPEKCRLVFRYSRIEGLSIPEISEKMCIADKTAEAHLTKALKTIRKNMSEEDLLVLLLTLGIIL